MSQDNLFQEIQDDLDRQRLLNFWQRYGLLIVGLAVAVILGTGAFTTWQKMQAHKNQKATSALLAITSEPVTDPSKRIEALQDFAKTDAGHTQAAFAQLEAAALAAKAGNKDQAIKLYDAVAADKNTQEAFRQFATLSSVEAQFGDGDASALSQRLDPLTLEKAPWRFSALELQGYLALRAGNKDKAKEIFTVLSQDASAPASLGERAGEILHSLAE